MGKFKLFTRFKAWLGRLLGTNKVYYINGTDTLPPPLTAEEEDEMIRNIDDASAKDALIEHNLQIGRAHV